MWRRPGEDKHSRIRARHRRLGRCTGRRRWQLLPAPAGDKALLRLGRAAGRDHGRAGRFACSLCRCVHVHFHFRFHFRARARADPPPRDSPARCACAASDGARETRANAGDAAKTSAEQASAAGPARHRQTRCLGPRARADSSCRARPAGAGSAARVGAHEQTGNRCAGGQAPVAKTPAEQSSPIGHCHGARARRGAPFRQRPAGAACGSADGAREQNQAAIASAPAEQTSVVPPGQACQRPAYSPWRRGINCCRR